MRMVAVRNHTIYEYIAAPKSSLRNIDGENGNEREKKGRNQKFGYLSISSTVLLHLVGAWDHGEDAQ